VESFIAVVLGLFGVLLVVAGVRSHGSALFESLTGSPAAADAAKRRADARAALGGIWSGTPIPGSPYKGEAPKGRGPIGLPPIPGVPMSYVLGTA
jgi:hypothetical protein